jgi:hypothetical protein
MTWRFTRREVMAGGAGALTLAASERAQAQQAKPNIIYIMADDLGYADVSCYGRRDYTTANIDKLAQGGMRFMQAYANSAVCSATRTALITRRYQYRYPIGLERAAEHARCRLVARRADSAVAVEEGGICDCADRQVASRFAAEIRTGEERL